MYISNCETGGTDEVCRLQVTRRLLFSVSLSGGESPCVRMMSPDTPASQHSGYVDMQWRSSITRFRHFAVKLYIFALFQLLLSGNSLLFKSAHFGPFDPVRLKLS